MGIEEKATYGEYYWAMQVEAQAKFDEDIEKAFAAPFARVIGEIPYLNELPSGLESLVRSLAEPPSAGFGGFALGVGVEMVDETLHAVLGPMMKMMARNINKRALETWLTSEQANTLFRRGQIEEDFWDLVTKSEGYEPVIGKFLYQSQQPYPTIPDLMLYARYHGDPVNTRELVWEYMDVNVREYDLWEFQTLQRITTEQAHTLYRRGVIERGDYYNEMAQIGWRGDSLDQLEKIGWSVPNAMLLVQGGLMGGKADAEILTDISIADINPHYSQTYLDGILTKPASIDIVNYQLRKDPSLNELDGELRKIGIHPAYWPVYKELAYQIPPVADIITMAVREAFTPAIAERFGQYEDFPEPFAKYAGMKGLSEDWAKRYWAAHWALPSPQQGFQMLHRGVIDRSELDLLLRAQDVMPFWREKLVQIAYRPLTRVDVRRMYREGVLDEREVYEAYLDAGYAEDNAQRMTDFTIKQTLSVLAKFTSNDVIKAYTSRMIDRSKASGMLTDLDIRYEDITYILSTADYKRSWAFTDSRIKGVRNLYRKAVYDADKARGELLRLDIATEQVDSLMEQWYYDYESKEPKTWTAAQTLDFMSTKLITMERGRQELSRIGYDDEHINVYIKAMQ